MSTPQDCSASSSFPVTVPCFPVVFRILYYRVCYLSVCTVSAFILADLELRMFPVYDPACGFTKQKCVIFFHERFYLTCCLAITNLMRFRSLFLYTHLLLYTEKISDPVSNTLQAGGYNYLLYQQVSLFNFPLSCDNI